LARKPIPIRSKNDLIGQDSLTMAGWLTRLSGGPMVLLKKRGGGHYVFRRASIPFVL